MIARLTVFPRGGSSSGDRGGPIRVLACNIAALDGLGMAPSFAGTITIGGDGFMTTEQHR